MVMRLTNSQVLNSLYKKNVWSEYEFTRQILYVCVLNEHQYTKETFSVLLLTFTTAPPTDVPPPSFLLPL